MLLLVVMVGAVLGDAGPGLQLADFSSLLQLSQGQGVHGVQHVQQSRGEKSLVNTFPFSQENHQQFANFPSVNSFSSQAQSGQVIPSLHKSILNLHGSHNGFSSLGGSQAGFDTLRGGAGGSQVGFGTLKGGAGSQASFSTFGGSTGSLPGFSSLGRDVSSLAGLSSVEGGVRSPAGFISLGGGVRPQAGQLESGQLHFTRAGGQAHLQSTNSPDFSSVAPSLSGSFPANTNRLPAATAHQLQTGSNQFASGFSFGQSNLDLIESFGQKLDVYQLGGGAQFPTIQVPQTVAVHADHPPQGVAVHAEHPAIVQPTVIDVKARQPLPQLPLPATHIHQPPVADPEYAVFENFNPNRARKPALGRGPGPVLDVVAKAEERCVDKVEQVEEIEYDHTEECSHTYSKKCHTSYSTEYTSQQEVECDESYSKECDITYSPSAFNETVTVCSNPLVKDCNKPGPVECRTEYVSECWTRQEEHNVVDDVAECETVYEEKCHTETAGYSSEEKCSKWPREVCSVNKKLNKKITPKTKCEKVPQQLCGPVGCGFVAGPEVCHEKTVTTVTDLPSESCNLHPRTNCDHVTKLVPKLVPVEECVDVPKEVCHTVRGPPRTVLKPVTKKWCYTPSPESGLY